MFQFFQYFSSLMNVNVNFYTSLILFFHDFFHDRDNCDVNYSNFHKLK